jgi:hypothetical protein
MVGKLGCGCCNADPPELCPDNDYLKTFSDDFSPAEEDDWIFSLDYFGTPAESFIARDGVLSLRGRGTSALAPNFSFGTGYIVCEKTSLLGNIEISLELVSFPVVQLTTGWFEDCRVGIGIWSAAESRQMWFEAVNVEARGLVKYNFRDFAWSPSSSNYNLQNVSSITPRLGDVLKLRLSDCIVDTFNPSNVVYQTITCLINDIPIFTQTPLGGFKLAKCLLYTGVFMRQFRFLIPRSETNPGTPYAAGMVIAKADNYVYESL